MLTKKSAVIIVAICLTLFWNIPQSNASETHEYRSNGEVGFYGSYKKKEQPATDEKNSKRAPNGNETGKVKNSVSQSTPVYSSKGQSIIPPMGDSSYSEIQVGGLVVLLSGFSILYLKKRREKL